MQSAPQELLKQYVQSQHFTSTADIMAAMKEMFRDVIQQVMEVEMDLSVLLSTGTHGAKIGTWSSVNWRSCSQIAK